LSIHNAKRLFKYEKDEIIYSLQALKFEFEKEMSYVTKAARTDYTTVEVSTSAGAALHHQRA